MGLERPWEVRSTHLLDPAVLKSSHPRVASSAFHRSLWMLLPNDSWSCAPERAGLGAGHRLFLAWGWVRSEHISIASAKIKTPLFRQGLQPGQRATHPLLSGCFYCWAGPWLDPMFPRCSCLHSYLSLLSVAPIPAHRKKWLFVWRSFPHRQGTCAKVPDASLWRACLTWMQISDFILRSAQDMFDGVLRFFRPWRDTYIPLGECRELLSTGWAGDRTFGTWRGSGFPNNWLLNWWSRKS